MNAMAFGHQSLFQVLIRMLPDVGAEVVKRGIDRFSAELLHPEVV
ncbi:hypothetical protein ACOI1C_19985 [Bacillus sp. DJP31]